MIIDMESLSQAERTLQEVQENPGPQELFDPEEDLKD